MVKNERVDFIKRLLFLLPIVLVLISCSNKPPSPVFESGVTMSATFTDGEKTFDVEFVTTNDKTLTLSVKNLPGYSITFSKNGVRVRFGDIEFQQNSDLFSRFSPIYQMYLDSFEEEPLHTSFNYSKKNTLESIVHSSGCVIKDIK